MKLAGRVEAVKPSATLAIDARAKELKAAGRDIVSFGAGEPDFETPRAIRTAAKKSIDAGVSKYAPVTGTARLKSAIVKKLADENGLEYAPDQVAVFAGAKMALYAVIQAVVEAGDEVIVPTPYWVSYPEMVTLAEGNNVFLPTDESTSFKITPDMLDAAFSAKTKIVIFNSPSNPTGQVYTRKELVALSGVLAERDVLVISDEIYEYLVYDRTEHVSIAALSDRMRAKTVVINGVSKSHAMTGWRIGYAAGPLDVIKAAGKIASHSTSGATTVSQEAAAFAVTSRDRYTKKMLREFNRRRKAMVALLNSVSGVVCPEPRGAFYAWADVSKIFGRTVDGIAITDSMSFAKFCLEKLDVAVVPGVAFGSDSHIRLSYACSMENIETGLQRLKKAFG